jgi:hypothetical protein
MATIYKQVAVALAENTFDIIEAEGGFPNISWLIARHLLRDYDEFIRHKSIDGMVAQVSNCIDKAIDYCENTLGVKIYRGYTKGGKGKLLEFITPDPNYKAAKEQDFQRMWRGVERKVTKAKHDVVKRHPEIGLDRLLTEGRLLMDNTPAQ